MAVIFQNKPGQVIALAAGPTGDAGLPLTIDGISGSWFPEFRAILTELSVGLDDNFQFTHTFDDVIFVYAFGSRISQMRISGLAFNGDCADRSGGGVTGIERVMTFYRTNRIAARATPIQLQVGTTAAGRFRGYLTNFRADIVKPEARLAQFAFIFHVFPGR